jgi:hypothetical protein
MTETVKYFLIVVILLTIIFSFSFTSCVQCADNISDNIAHKTPPSNVVNPQYLPKPYPGLGTTISELVSAYESGGDTAAMAYAKDHGIRFVDSMILVHIDVQPGSKTAAMDAVNKAGGKDIIVSDNYDFIGAFIPLNQINSLTKNPAIKLISQPPGVIAN